MQHHHQTRTCRPKLQEGHVAFKVVCYKSLIRGLIGSVISKIRRQTSCHIHCEQLIQGADHCIIHVAGSDGRERKITLNDAVSGEPVVSAAQEGVIRILERMWELESGDLDTDSGSEGYCRLLLNTSDVGAVVGKGGKHIAGMRRYSGANIVILPPPLCANKNEELIQITGGKLAVKKAVIAVTSRLQQPTVLRHVGKSARVSPYVELFPHLSSLLPHLTPADVDLKHNAREVCFRLLCSNGAAGSIIGKRGSIVQDLQNITGASIVFDSATNVSGGRIVTVSASEDVKTEYSPAQNAVVLVFARAVEHEIESGRSGLTEGSNVTAKFLVESDVAFCLSGNGERIDPEIVRASGAEIFVLKEERVLESSRSEVVVQISGEYKNVQSALFLVTSRIRNLLSNDVANEVRKRDLYGREREIASPTSQLSAGLCLHSDRLGLYDRKSDPSTVSHPPLKLGTDYTPNGNDNGCLANFVKGTVTSCLQQPTVLRHVGKSDRVSPYVELFPHLSSLLPHLTPADVDLKHNAREVCFRLLCSNGAAGSIIGKRGSIVRDLQNITGASIVFDSATNVSGGRIVTVSALEDVKTEYSPAQNAVVFVFARSVEYEIENGRSGLTEGSNVTAKFLVESDVALCLSGNGERIDPEIVRASGAEIFVLKEERVLESSRSEVVVQISGEYKNVQSALFLVTRRIRSLLSNDVANEVRKRDLYGRERGIASPTSQLSAGLCLHSDQEINLTTEIDRLGLSDCKIDPLTVSHPRKKLGTDYTPNGNNNGSLANFVRATELERSLHFLLPREVLDDFGSGSSNGEVKENASSGLYLSFGPSSSNPSVGTPSIQGYQTDLSGRIDYSAPGVQPLKEAGRVDRIANQGTAKESTTHERSGKPERKRSVIIANTTLELIVSDDLIRSIYGENGCNLENLREISGAKVEVRDPTPGKSEGMVIISGSPDQTRMAESLIHAFI